MYIEKYFLDYSIEIGWKERETWFLVFSWSPWLWQQQAVKKKSLKKNNYKICYKPKIETV